MTHEHGRVLPAEGPRRQGVVMNQEPGNIIVIAASAGGVQALRRLVSQLRCSSSSISGRTGPAFCRTF